eukprot:GEMP01059208.1.p1 GENE.GEMP01059208.1~~GEMP01059208.1.p1  ORF type:complete len:190 (+),score=42.11 GEMP01059208.1:359-928(+)
MFAVQDGRDGGPLFRIKSVCCRAPHRRVRHESDYKELDQTHSPLRRKVTAMCFTVDPIERPTISQVLELLTPAFVMHLERKLREEKAASAPGATKRTVQTNIPRKMTIPQNAVVERGADPVDAILDVMVALVRKATIKSETNVDPYFFQLPKNKHKAEAWKLVNQSPDPLPCCPSESYASLYKALYETE